MLILLTFLHLHIFANVEEGLNDGLLHKHFIIIVIMLLQWMSSVFTRFIDELFKILHLCIISNLFLQNYKILNMC